MFEPKNEYINNDIAARARSYAREKLDEIKEFQILNPWIGIYHLHKDKKTVFASDNTEVDWTYWDANEPNNVNADENCTHLYTSPKYETSYFLKDCIMNFIADGKCHDETNTKECAWDGGDCCGEGLYVDANTVDDLGDPTCSSCQCLEPSRWNDINCDESRRFICEKMGSG